MDGFPSYVYVNSNSSAQWRYTQERIAEQRRQRGIPQPVAIPGSEPPSNALSRTTSAISGASEPGTSGVLAQQQIYRESTSNYQKRDAGNYGDMETSGRLPSPRSSSSSTSEQAHQSLLNNPFELRHGRRYLRDLPYPLPVDLTEIHRQNLKTLLKCRAFGDRAVCAPNVKKKSPKKVLEIACGSGLWSAKCHEYFSLLGHKNVSFTGLDVAPLAPDMRKQGVNWKFVQHDLRRVPWPFEDESFDFVMLKDISLAMPLGIPSERLIDESIRVLAIGGTLEVWESDHIIRSLLPHPPAAPRSPFDREIAASTATFHILSGTPFASAQNKFLQNANAWINAALDKRKLPPAPCTRIAPVLYQEADQLSDVGMLRLAIPLGELRWEKDGSKHGRSPSDAVDSVMSKGKGKVPEKALTPDQLALRQTALLVILQKIESLEPILKDVSGKNTEEWSHWWASMMSDLLNPASGGGVTSEVVEIGAWWATKIESE